MSLSPSRQFANVAGILGASFTLGCAQQFSALSSHQLGGQQEATRERSVPLVRECLQLGPQPALAPVYSLNWERGEGDQLRLRRNGQDPAGFIRHPGLQVEISYPEGARPNFFRVELEQAYREAVRLLQVGFPNPILVSGTGPFFPNVNSAISLPMSQLEEGIRRFTMRRHTNVLSVSFHPWEVVTINVSTAAPGDYLVEQPAQFGGAPVSFTVSGETR